ncbi:LysM peptidoglycan-binding domain-containing protein [Marivivens donghaensis]|uniref:LysM peptidoglycan-binding domain-containing protein n=1 Tax=Marivivens donghaensis TaxID=1699413 RepID=A0ABX0W0L7_9RHOB|nr:LysM peptidoglycan-binding domain-containing protein [Marivivens donghaensis]NIY73882.1 LysM peptidoglycan-binding domain-containing protein [Marivivens donghaensis]
MQAFKVSILALLSPTSLALAEPYTVQGGDTLYGIAARELGNGARWPEICTANETNLADCENIYPGLVLEIPNGQQESDSSGSDLLDAMPEWAAALAASADEETVAQDDTEEPAEEDEEPALPEPEAVIEVEEVEVAEPEPDATVIDAPGIFLMTDPVEMANAFGTTAPSIRVEGAQNGAMLSGSVSTTGSPRIQGAFLTLDAEQTASLAGQRVTAILRVQSDHTGMVGVIGGLIDGANSGWKMNRLSEGPNFLPLNFNLPEDTTDHVFAIGVQPDPNDEGQSITVTSVAIGVSD